MAIQLLVLVLSLLIEVMLYKVMEIIPKKLK